MPPTCKARNRMTIALNQLYFLTTISDCLSPRPERVRRHDSRLQGEDWVRELLNGHPTVFFEQTRMPRLTFCRLQRWIELNHRLTRRRKTSMSIEEMLIMFLWMVGHNASNRDAQSRFQHSGRTISKTFKRVLNALLPLYDDFVKPPEDRIPSQLTRTERDWNKLHEFHNIRGAIDGTHIPAFLPPAEKAPFRNPQGIITQNVLAGCTLDLLFFYVLPGWEGSAHDARVLKYALEQDPTFPQPSPSQVYLADAGYSLRPGILVPYKKVRYHLREQAQATQQPKNKEELFNLRHAQLRNVIERLFGVLKKRFRILDTAPQYSFDIQGKLILVLCALHNFIRILANGREDTFYVEADEDLPCSPPHDDIAEGEEPQGSEKEPIWEGRGSLFSSQPAQYRKLVPERDAMAERMWQEYQHYLLLLPEAARLAGKSSSKNWLSLSSRKLMVGNLHSGPHSGIPAIRHKH